MLGMMAVSKAGHDKNKIYVIVGEDETYVYLSDGEFKKIETPKRKRKKHIQPIVNNIDTALSDKLHKNEVIRNEEIKKAIKDYDRLSKGNQLFTKA
jgi:hypothetical protein